MIKINEEIRVTPIIPISSSSNSTKHKKESFQEILNKKKEMILNE